MDVCWLHRKPQNISCYPQSRHTPVQIDPTLPACLQGHSCCLSEAFPWFHAGYQSLRLVWAKKKEPAPQPCGCGDHQSWIVLFLLFYHVIIFMMHTNQSSTSGSNWQLGHLRVGGGCVAMVTDHHNTVTSALSEQLSECNRQPTSGWSLIRAQTLKTWCVLQVRPSGVSRGRLFILMKQNKIFWTFSFSASNFY